MTHTKFIFSFVIFSFTFLSLTQAQDWANFGKFKKDNAELERNVANRIVFMGNSITIGWLNKNPEFFEGKPYVNRGISGQTTPQMLVRFRADVVNLNPKAVVILAGINDIAGNTGPTTLYEIADNIRSMAEIADANGIKVVLCSVLPAFDFPWSPGLNPAENVVALNKMIKEIARKNNHTYVDYFPALADDRNGLIEAYTHDGVHPNKAGYQVMATVIDKVLSKIMRR